MPVPVSAAPVELLLAPGQRELAPGPDQGSSRTQNVLGRPQRPPVVWAASSAKQLPVLPGRHGHVRGGRAHHQRHVQLVQLQGLGQEGEQKQQEEQKCPGQEKRAGPGEAAKK